MVPYTLAQNAGLNALLTVTELRNRHASGDQCAGINVRRGTITDILEENVVQPLLVSTSAFTLATECVCMILKIVRTHTAGPTRPCCKSCPAVKRVEPPQTRLAWPRRTISFRRGEMLFHHCYLKMHLSKIKWTLLVMATCASDLI